MPENKNPPENEEQKISRVGEEIECQQPYCKETALSLSSYCLIHTEDKEEYREKIREWAKAGKSMESFMLIGVDLSSAMLGGANLSGAMLGEANLSGAILREANLSGAWLREANLSGAWLGEANLSGAGLRGANLSGAWLSGANLSGAMLGGANLSGAKLGGAKLIDARVNWAKLTGVRGLYRRNFSKELTEKEKEEAEEFKESYMTVKNYFIQIGRYDDASWAAFRERTLERIDMFNNLYYKVKKKGIKGLLSWLWFKTAIKWLLSKVMSLLNGYGERPLRAVVSAVAIVIGFSLFYFFSKCIEANPPNGIRWWDYLYFSIVTFTTLGYGDIRPLAAPWARMVASGEAFIGAFMIALFVWTLARRYVAR